MFVCVSVNSSVNYVETLVGGVVREATVNRADGGIGFRIRCRVLLVVSLDDVVSCLDSVVLVSPHELVVKVSTERSTVLRLPVSTEREAGGMRVSLLDSICQAEVTRTQVSGRSLRLSTVVVLVLIVFCKVELVLVFSVVRVTAVKKPVAICVFLHPAVPVSKPTVDHLVSGLWLVVVLGMGEHSV